ncbi:carbohydrate kinase (thermoresistant glucokinase family) [Pseudarthrobacter oxydans]|uniref:gluconokinase n=1 Tax=Pseudarthrobacter oxydans TaxID=1671 RepID=UPI0027831F71|nr:gluconokinase [Pseudarthrobacter oxydans]MDP9983938.1 carbohydrate kinase (thermoresistant glucokinase family) [Pseudarthrobacter oxydans]
MTRPIVVMGVSGAGKSTVGSALAARLGAEFLDADSLHPPANVQKMASGNPLTDEDRWPWLKLVGAALSAPTSGVVVACSALRRAYRDAIRASAPSTTFVLLNVATPVLQDRLPLRPGHFMPASLLTSQLETLEPLEADESGLAVMSEEGIESTAERILLQLGASA